MCLQFAKVSPLVVKIEINDLLFNKSPLNTKGGSIYRVPKGYTRFNFFYEEANDVT